MTALPDNPEEIEMQAAEYVLGTLDARAARNFEQAMQDNADLRRMVQQWETRLAPLIAMATPEAPPPDLWTRIEAALPVPGKASRLGSTTPSLFLRVWQAWALGATAVAAALALLTVVPPKTEPRMMTVLVSDPAQPAWTAEVEPQGGLRLAAVSAPAGQPATQVPDGKILQLWGLPPGATVPVSLGLLPRGANVLRIPAPAVRPVGGMQIMISLEPEPANGVAGSAPTGPVVFIGRLSTPGPNT
jgi:anti-sigma-K factor RskA